MQILFFGLLIAPIANFSESVIVVVANVAHPVSRSVFVWLFFSFLFFREFFGGFFERLWLEIPSILLSESVVLELVLHGLQIVSF